MANQVQGFEWTATEVQTKQGFSVGVGNKHPSQEQPRFIVLRYNDERSSKLCQRMEEMSRSSGGLVINDSAAIQRGLSDSYRTHLFHDNCRCRLVLKPSALPEKIDDTDFELATQDTSLSRTELQRAESFFGPDFSKQYSSQDYRRRVEMVKSVNESGRHYLHDRRGRM